MNAETCLDTTTLEKLHQLGGHEFALHMIDLFLAYVPEKLAEARAGLAEGNLLRVQKAAHPIKSSAGNIGAPIVHDLAERMEQAAIAQNREAIPALLAELEAAYARVKISLEEKRRVWSQSEASCDSDATG